MSETEPTRTLADLRDLAVAAAVPQQASDAPKREAKLSSTPRAAKSSITRKKNAKAVSVAANARPP